MGTRLSTKSKSTGAAFDRDGALAAAGQTDLAAVWRVNAEGKRVRERAGHHRARDPLRPVAACEVGVDGVDVEARPPGKKLQTISLLSGGEQTMTVYKPLHLLADAAAVMAVGAAASGQAQKPKFQFISI